MSRQINARSSQEAYDGAAIIALPLGEVAHAVGAANGTYFTIPFDCYVKEAILGFRNAGTHASAAALVGTAATPGALFNKNVHNLTGNVVLSADSEFTSASARNLSRGDIINLNTAAASAVGQVACTLVLVPRQDS